MITEQYKDDVVKELDLAIAAERQGKMDKTLDHIHEVDRLLQLLRYDVWHSFHTSGTVK